MLLLLLVCSSVVFLLLVCWFVDLFVVVGEVNTYLQFTLEPNIPCIISVFCDPLFGGFGEVVK